MVDKGGKEYYDHDLQSFLPTFWVLCLIKWAVGSHFLTRQRS